jgi:peptidoglycan/xylan/chitin deacetylase (PgdA/CDA1 family)
VLIVAYHAIAGPASPVCCPPAQFEADLLALADAGFTFVSLDDCADWLSRARELPRRSVAVTFDDAYASVFSAALPLLSRLRVPATVFVIGNRIGGDNQWPGQWRSIPSMPLADIGQLKEAAAAGISLGSHSWSHAMLTSIDDEALLDEVDASANRLEDLLCLPIRHFAYPYGVRGRREVAAAARRYRTAVNADPRPVTHESNPFDLGRIDAHDLRVALRAGMMGELTLGPYLGVRRGLRGVRRRTERVFGRR